MALPKRLKKTVLALLVLVIPGVCYMLLRTGTNYYQQLPSYGPDGAMELDDGIPASSYYHLDSSLFVSLRKGKKALPGPIYVAGFVRGQASAQAETLAVNMVRLAKTYHDLEGLQFVAFIATDSPAVYTPFEQMLDSYDAEGEKWLRLRLPEREATRIAREDFFLEPALNAAPGDPVSDTLVLVDSFKRIRGYYDGSSYFDTDTLKDEIVVLLKEELNRDDEQ